MGVGFWEGRRDGEPLDQARLREVHQDWRVRTRATAELGDILSAWVRRGWLAAVGGGYCVRAALWAIATAFHNRRAAV